VWSVFCIESSIVWAGDTAIMVPFWEAYAVATLGLGEFVGAESSSLRTWITLGYSGPACNHRPKVDRLKAHRTDSSNPNLGRQCI